MKTGKRREKAVRVESSKVVFKGRVFWVTRDAVVEPGGVRIVREVVRHVGSSVILPRRADGRILLVRQFRLPSRRFLWELAAGRLDPGEKPLDAAKRELREETGFSARRWKLLASFYPSPGYVGEKMWLFLAENLRLGLTDPDPDEVISHHWFSLAQVGEMVRSRKIEDGKTLVGYLMLRHRGLPDA